MTEIFNDALEIVDSSLEHTSPSLVPMSSSETTIPSPKQPAFLLMQ